MDVVTYAVAKKYVDETVIGGGALKGKNCTIQSITPIAGGNRITFKWTLDNGTELTNTLDIMNGTVYDYSTNERVVGRWINGKPLYQISRILENELTVNAMFTYIPEFSNVEGIETVISGEVFPGTKGPDVYFIAGALSQPQFSMDGACIRTNSFDITVTLQAGSVITIRYTKTTN